LQATVSTSILDQTMEQHLAVEMLHVVKPEDLILWEEYYVNILWNLDVRSVPKAEITQLFPGCTIVPFPVRPNGLCSCPVSWSLPFLHYVV
jgi:hypothetical protein